MTFKRENRYSVIKWKDAEKYLSPDELETLALIGASITASRLVDEKPELECVVVEQDWPEYESTWQAIKGRMESESE